MQLVHNPVAPNSLLRFCDVIKSPDGSADPKTRKHPVKLKLVGRSGYPLNRGVPVELKRGRIILVRSSDALIAWRGAGHGFWAGSVSKVST